MVFLKEILEKIRFLKKSADDKRACKELIRLAPVSNVNFFSKTDYLSKIAIYKLYLEVEVLNLTIREDRIFSSPEPKALR